MQKHLAYIFVVIFCNYIQAQQKHDFVWILGSGPNLPEFWAGGNLINFQDGNPEIRYFDITYDMDNPVNMSDNQGRLQFYSSGCDILNSSYGVMENGDQLSEGPMHNLYCDNFGWGYDSYQGILSLPWPGDTNQYVLLHSRFKSTNYYDSTGTEVLYTLVNMADSNGLGLVTDKNLPLAHGLFSRTYTATRHANGRDWWIIIPEEKKSIYHLYLLDPQGFKGPFTQQPDASWIPGQYGNAMCAFSPDGSQFVRTGGVVPAAFRLYDFNRCSGILSNSQTIAVPDTTVGAPWACFSPNSRYLYFTNKASKLFQYDTEASDISASVQLVGEQDDFLSVWDLPAGPYAMAIGPDKRIYITSANGVNILHTIEWPDRAGIACDFRPHSVWLPATIVFLPPNQPNYRLYNEAGSYCDTLGVIAPIVSFWRSEQDSMASSSLVHFTDLSYYQPVSWFWDFGDGMTDTTQNPSHQYAPGIYTACLTVCNDVGDCDSQCREIEILTVGTTDILGNIFSIKLVPNPATDVVQIQFEAAAEKNCWVSVFDLAGKRVLNEPIPEGELVHVLDVSGCQNGMYLVLVTEAGQVVARKKLVVLR